LSKSDSLNRVAITPGEPAGIGGDLLVSLAQQARSQSWVAIADRDEMTAVARRLNLPLEIDENLDAPTLEPGRLTVCHVPLRAPVQPGILNPDNAGYVLEMLTTAAEGALARRFASLVTGPVQKSVINDAGIAFSGHTEFFRDLAGVGDVVMLLAARDLRVALATTHLPLRDVPDAITAELLNRRLRLLLDSLQQRFRIDSPRILVAGLNPHAGEGGHLGDEEQRVIIPVCEALRSQGADIVGPLPADTLFTPRLLESADAVMAMYHDQGLPVLKHYGFGEAVNITLGLPFVRTSVDHGTALDLAGTGAADAGSLRSALRLAGQLTDGPSRPEGVSRS
jgi:4-hydroxythreonine-4-phosphate dehydrogenase